MSLALALILIARRVRRAQSIAVWVVLAAAAAIGSGWAFSGEGPRTGFGGAIAGDGYAQFFNALFAATLALVALLSVRRLETERVRPAEYFALLLLASTGMMLAASALDPSRLRHRPFGRSHVHDVGRDLWHTAGCRRDVYHSIYDLRRGA